MKKRNDRLVGAAKSSRELASFSIKLEKTGRAEKIRVTLVPQSEQWADTRASFAEKKRDRTVS